MRVLIHFARFGPYHHARLRTAHEVLGQLGWEVIGLEIASKDATYAWDETKGAVNGPRVVTAFPGRVHEEITSAEYREVLLPLLDSLKPDAMAIAGWGSRDALGCFSWCISRQCPIIVMSDSTAWDEPRVWWKEKVKSRLLAMTSAALVAGGPHRDYLLALGRPADSIFMGYDVVDNSYFARKAELVKTNAQEEDVDTAGRHQEPISGLRYLHPFFLASSRFVEKKNLFRLIDAYAAYAHKSPCCADDCERAVPSRPVAWNLCLLGDGGLKGALIARCRKLNLHVIESAPWEGAEELGTEHKSPNTVFFPGFRQIDELPRFYAHADAFVHASTTEQWGLVVNEAMACGLPVIVSNRVGCAKDLVQEGWNGFTFDPLDVSHLASLLERIATMSLTERESMGAASRDIIGQWGPERFAASLMAAADKAISTGPKRAGLADSQLLKLLAKR